MSKNYLKTIERDIAIPTSDSLTIYGILHYNMKYPVPFYSNTPDDTHCFQASLRMVLKYFRPEREYDSEELDKVTAKVEGLWTWPNAGLMWMQEQGFDVKVIDVFDTQRFINEGVDYLTEEWGEAVSKEQAAHSDIEQERQIAREYLQHVQTDQRIPTFHDIRVLLDDGWLLIVNVNWSVLQGVTGYIGHMVVVIGYEDGFIIAHDPGSPAYAERKIDTATFEKAWAYPNERAKNVTAFKLKK